MFSHDLEDMYKPEELNAELKARMYTGSFGPYINHPLVQSIPHSDMMNRRANLMLQHKKTAIEAAVKSKDWHSVIFLHERPFRLDAFVEYTDALTPEEYWPLVAQMWTDSENIWENIDLWADLWSAPNRRPELVMEEDELEAFNALPSEHITIYRGSTKGLSLGMSWTTDRQKAEWFAKRYGSDNPVVHERFIDKSDVLAYFHRRDESEIVVMPYALG